MIFTIEVNQKQLMAKRGETVLECLKRNGINVPTLCHMASHSPTGACRICVVEVEGKQNLIPSCSYPVEEWMKIKTHSPRVIKARKTIVELLLSNHPDDCLYCERNGNCELQDLAIDLNVRERRFTGKKNILKKDHASSSITRDPAKCILCGRCVRVCEEVEAVSAIDFIRRGSKMVIGTVYNKGLNKSSCVNCGQCIMVCPTGALHERSNLADVQEALHNTEKTVLVHFSPSVAVSLGEEFGIRTGKDIAGIIAAALRKIGFNKVFDTAFAADVSILEIAALLERKILNNEKLPMFSGCCPAWIQYAEEFNPELLCQLSSVKSPQQIMGAMLKTFFAEENQLDPSQIYTVALMPCTAKKTEAQRQEMTVNGITHIDAVLTTRELANLIKLHGIDIQNIEPELPDNPYGMRSSSARLFASSGGVVEALVRTLHVNLTGKELENLKISEMRNSNNRKEIKVQIGKHSLGFAAVSGLANAKKLLEEIKNGRNDLHFVEVMACEGGCINGGGQPIGSGDKELKARQKTLYELDDKETIRVSHKNPQVIELYQKHFNKPLSEETYPLLHTTYCKRDVML